MNIIVHEYVDFCPYTDTYTFEGHLPYDDYHLVLFAVKDGPTASRLIDTVTAGEEIMIGVDADMTIEHGRMVHMVEIVGEYPLFSVYDLNDLPKHLTAHYENYKGDPPMPIVIKIREFLYESEAIRRFPESFEEV